MLVLTVFSTRVRACRLCFTVAPTCWKPIFAWVRCEILGQVRMIKFIPAESTRIRFTLLTDLVMVMEGAQFCVSPCVVYLENL